MLKIETIFRNKDEKSKVRVNTHLVFSLLYIKDFSLTQHLKN